MAISPNLAQATVSKTGQRDIMAFGDRRFSFVLLRPTESDHRTTQSSSGEQCCFRSENFCRVRPNYPLAPTVSMSIDA